MTSDAGFVRNKRNNSSRIPLITPSASPPPLSPFAKIDATLHKPPRRPSTQRSSSTRPSGGAIGSKIDVQKEQEASLVRLLDTWSQLAERYSRRLDEDDIVDIRTGKIIKDNGFWRKNRTFTFGQALGSPEGNEEAEEVSEDEGSDELDAFSDGHDVLEGVILRHSDHLSNGTHLSSDADDLREFFEAERRRKEDFGSDLEEEEFERPPSIDKGTTPLSYSDFATNNDGDDANEEGSTCEQAGTSSPLYDTAPELSASEDELDNWEPTDASIVVVTASTQSHSEDDSESEVEIIKRPVLRTPSLSPQKKRISPTQLYTPPPSHSSVDNPGLVHFSSSFPSSSPPSSPLLLHDSSDLGEGVSASPTTSRSRNLQVQKIKENRTISQTIIEISDEDVCETTSSRPAASLPRVHSKIRNVAPEVVITTLPPQSNRTKNTTASSTRSRHLKATQKTSYECALKKIDDGADIKGGPGNIHRARSLQATEAPIALGRRSGKELHDPSPEICGPMLPERSTRRSPKFSANRSSTSKVLNHKRKRSSSEHEPHTIPLLVASETRRKGRVSPELQESATGKEQSANLILKLNVNLGRNDGTVGQPSSRRSRSQIRHATPSDDSDGSYTDEGLVYRPRHALHRFPSTPVPSMRPIYAPQSHPQAPYPSELYPPATDPRAQQIITNAMQQLATLLWTPACPHPPNAVYSFTPTDNRVPSVEPSLILSTPNHPRPYLFTYDPSMSKATLPPSSPELPSSPIKPKERRGSIVARSRSRGRKVSFRLESIDGAHSESESGSELPSSPTKRKSDKISKIRRPDRSKKKGKGKRNAIVQDISYSDSEDKYRLIPTVSERAQTPAPERWPRVREPSASTSYTCSSETFSLKY